MFRRGRSGSRRVPHRRKSCPGHPAPSSDRAEPRHRSSVDRDRELLARFSSSQHIADVVSELLGRDRGHRPDRPFRATAIGHLASDSDERQLRALRIVGSKRLTRRDDLLLRADPLTAGLLRHHVRVGVEADGRVVAELRGDLDDRQPALVDQQRRERVPQVVRPRAVDARPPRAVGL